MFVVTFALLFLTRGRSYYLAPAYAMFIAAGSAWWESWLASRGQQIRRIGWAFSWGLLAVASLIGVVLVKPIVPIGSPLWAITSDVSGEVREMIGWPELVQQVAAVYEVIPDADKPGTVILAGNYGEAGALDLYGPAYGLPRVISGSNSLWARWLRRHGARHRYRRRLRPSLRRTFLLGLQDSRTGVEPVRRPERRIDSPHGTLRLRAAASAVAGHVERDAVVPVELPSDQ